MADTEEDLKSEVRDFTGYTSEEVLSPSGLDTAFSRAEKHLRVSSGIDPNADWFTDEFPQREEALFWYTCLFCKVTTGELDESDFQVGAIDERALLAKDNNSVTEWYRKAREAKNALNPAQKWGITTPARASDNREYPAHAAREYEDDAGSDFDI